MMLSWLRNGSYVSLILCAVKGDRYQRRERRREGGSEKGTFFCLVCVDFSASRENRGLLKVRSCYCCPDQTRSLFDL